MVIANQLAVDCIKSLKDSHWIQGGQMSEGNVKKFLEFFSYTFLIPEKITQSGSDPKLQNRGEISEFHLRARDQSTGKPTQHRRQVSDSGTRAGNLLFFQTARACRSQLFC